MVTSEDFTSDPENVNYVIKWWVSESKHRYHCVRCRGTMKDFQQDVWVSILKTFINKSHIDASLLTVIMAHCQWTLFRRTTRHDLANRKRAFDIKLSMSRQIRADDRIEDAETCLSFAESRLLNQTIMDLITTLTRREGIIVKARFGIDRDEMTLEQLGQELFISRERVRQIEQKAISKLKHHTRASRLMPFVDIQDKTDAIDENAAKQMQSTEYGAALFEELTKDR